METSPTSAIWDIHHHWVNEAGYINRLLRQMDRLGTERTGLIAMGPVLRDLFVSQPKATGCAGDAEVAKLLKQHGDRFWGYGYVRPGRSNVDDVDRLADMGMTALKFHLPARRYDDPEYFALYARAQEHKLPCLFHTGIFYPPAPMPGEGIRSENYRPIHLEPIAQEFPDLVLIAAHLGIPWHDEAASVCRICSNVYADLSGRSDGWRSSKTPEWFRRILYWDQADRKILFGSDVHLDELAETIEDHRKIFEWLGWGAEQRANAFCKNARRIFGTS